MRERCGSTSFTASNVPAAKVFNKRPSWFVPMRQPTTQEGHSGSLPTSRLLTQPQHPVARVLLPEIRTVSPAQTPWAPNPPRLPKPDLPMYLPITHLLRQITIMFSSPESSFQPLPKCYYDDRHRAFGTQPHTVGSFTEGRTTWRPRKLNPNSTESTANRPNALLPIASAPTSHRPSWVRNYNTNYKHIAHTYGPPSPIFRSLLPHISSFRVF